MRQLFLGLLLVSLLIGGGLFVGHYFDVNFPSTSEITTPGPLRVTLPKKLGSLTITGIIAETNQRRIADKAPSLIHNPTLDQAAQKKADDILARQYFDHIAPDGIGPADLVEGVGYAYLRVGENLALGAFPDDATLVQAWMDSPGHRANILSARFSEIGVGLSRGRFEGDDVWIAVQTFAAPAASCPTPGPTAKTNIETKRAELEQVATELEQEQAALVALADRINQGEGSKQDVSDFAKQQAAYNNQVSYYQALQADLQALIDTFNQKIRLYNACLNR